MHNYVPVGVAELSAEALTRHGLYHLLRDAGVQLRIAEQAICARKAGATEARLLHETRGAPLLTMQRTAYDHANRAVEYGSHVYRASRYTFELTLVSRYRSPSDTCSRGRPAPPPRVNQARPRP